MLRSMSQYLASLILLIVVVVGLSFVNSFYTSRIMIFEKTINNNMVTYDISLIDCVNNVSYYYNYGDTIYLKTPVSVLSENKTWISSYIIPSKSIFRIEGCNDFLILNTTNGQVVIKT